MRLFFRFFISDLDPNRFMKNWTRLIVGAIIIIFTQACSIEKKICPAYQSAFIHDQEALDRHFSYFKEDSTPKLASVDKNRFLIVESKPYRKKLRSLQTIPMRDVYPVEDDSLAFDDEIPLAEREYGYDSTAVIKEEIDTTATATDSIYMISKKKEDFNIDQELYLWYLRDFLVYPDVRLQLEQNAEATQQQEKAEKKGFFGFFKNLFGGKKNKSDTTGVETNATEVEGEPEKKDLFGGLFKKKDKQEEPEEDEPENNNEGTVNEEEDF